jgi:hypothetical protein
MVYIVYILYLLRFVYCVYSLDVYAILWEDMGVYEYCKFVGRIMFVRHVCMFMRRRVCLWEV